ncbi:hypothetical protein F3Y22_tig00112699pilonHSYRG00022 [Hibiscus syriacus]|uniref:Chloroplast sensor kinase n=1 Tax=Hibiscus syriacus TaxID=106335 RepID=A0A6A2XCK6_HIBSY|nr:hypothetical protein F3Y22_tig00112699pilonHSYRG00022 [Hibiscus syriacus]
MVKSSISQHHKLDLPHPSHADGNRNKMDADVLGMRWGTRCAGVDAAKPLAHQQQRIVELSELSQPLQVAIEEPALRQALINLIEGALLRTQVGGKVEIVSTSAPAGGALLVIDDVGPDMHYMMHSLTPFSGELFSENMIEDNMTWNFVAGLTVAREILESYGCVVRVISPRTTDAALGAGRTRVELWFPSFSALSDINNLSQEA